MGRKPWLVWCKQIKHDNENKKKNGNDDDETQIHSVRGRHGQKTAKQNVEHASFCIIAHLFCLVCFSWVKAIHTFPSLLIVHGFFF